MLLFSTASVFAVSHNDSQGTCLSVDAAGLTTPSEKMLGSYVKGKPGTTVCSVTHTSFWRASAIDSRVGERNHQGTMTVVPTLGVVIL